MNIGIDARFAIHNRRGIGNYTLNLLCHLAELDKENLYFLYIDKEDEENVLPTQPNFIIRNLMQRNYFLWEQLYFPIAAKKDKVDIIHCTGNTSPITHILPKKTKIITTLHDVMFLKGKSVIPTPNSRYQKMGRIYRKFVVNRMMKYVELIITVSTFSKNDILRHFPWYDNKKIQVIYEAANDCFKDDVRLDEFSDIPNKMNGDNYILTLGADDHRKNTRLVIEKYIEAIKDGRIDCNLVIVGMPNWRNSEMYSIVEKTEFANKIIFMDFINETELVYLYKNATMFLYPSLYEGFGIPPLESMACGTPVITSNTTSIPEIVEDAALTINPSSGEELKQGIIELFNNEMLRKELSVKGLQRVQKFSWRNMAFNTLEVYKSLMEK
ncbi:glycosyltransferase family 4 protein ['Paenibacillus yunnanensis' Narsing Rao et al. 2020]|uniref:glycosyltransferase family 4 protein n=1 Tax=Paenibacillus tengchongensis TaxID=2608684 RepID=UPI00124E1193|nr:glycosyltransferase family 1 protein [Paenibacillus tengchongensis]